MKTNTANHDEHAVIKLHEEVLSAFNTLNLEKLLSLHTDNIILMEPNMPAIQGKQEIIQLFEKFQKHKIELKLSFKIQELEVFGERAFVRGQVMKTTVQQFGQPVMDIGKFISLSQKQKDGTWLRTHVIVNSDTTTENEAIPSRETNASRNNRILMGVHDRVWK